MSTIAELAGAFGARVMTVSREVTTIVRSEIVVQRVDGGVRLAIYEHGAPQVRLLLVSEQALALADMIRDAANSAGDAPGV